MLRLTNPDNKVLPGGGWVAEQQSRDFFWFFPSLPPATPRLFLVLSIPPTSNPPTFFGSSHPFHLENVTSAMTEPQSKIFKDNPIGKGLDAFRTLFNSICKDRSILCSPDTLGQLDLEGMVSQLRCSVLV